MRNADYRVRECEKGERFFGVSFELAMKVEKISVEKRGEWKGEERREERR